VLNLLFVRALTAHLPPSSALVVNAVNPGYCATAFSRHVPRTFSRWLMELLLQRRGEEGAKAVVWAALAGSGPAEPIGVRESLRGAFSEDCMVKEESDAVLSIAGEKTQEKIWVC
jgi:retinol dehydrogenase-12